jgi:hypothetical protein
MPVNNSSSDTSLANRWVPIFRAGEHTSMEGAKSTYSEADLDHIVRKYDPDYHEAPAVVGHPKHDAPAYGWVKGVKREGETLFAKFGEVYPEFDQMVQQGLFKKRSASFYVKPDGLELRHVAFLGAQPPAVKGLAEIKFEEGDHAEIEFQEGSMADKTVKEQISEFFAELFSGKNNAAAAATSFSEADAQRLIDIAVAPLKAENLTLKTKLEEQSASFAEREKKLTTGEQSGRVAGAVNVLRTAGKWIPAFEKMGLTLVFAELARKGETIEFGEGDQKKQIAPLDLLVSFLEKLPKIVPGGIKVDQGNLVQFAEAKRPTNGSAPVDPNSEQLNGLAKARQAEKKISFSEALTEIAREHPELTVPGGAAAGAV